MGAHRLTHSEQYNRVRMTTVNEAAKTGIGRILANFSEIPALARSIVEETIDRLKAPSIDGVFTPGNMSEPVCRIAVGMNRVGMVSSGGLNPVAAAVEVGIEVETVSESGMIDFQQLTSFW